MSYKRSRFFVDPAFQGRLLLRLVTYWAGYHVALWLVMFLLNLLDAGVIEDATQPLKSFWVLYREFAAQHVSVLICFLVMLPIIGRDLIKFSHRLAGPLIRFRNTMRAMVEGKPVSPITLRQNDLPSEFLQAFNNLVETWNARLSSPPPAQPSDEELELSESTR